MLKQRISPDGHLLGEPGVEIVGELDKSEPLPPDYCGSCYGANIVGMPCCNSCDDLKKAYSIMGWSDHGVLKNSTQCLHDVQNPFAHVKKGEGCRLTGHALVNKVSGNFHVAFGDSIVRDGMHIHQFLPQEAPTFNVSHTIHSLSFGDPYPGMPPNPLDNGNLREKYRCIFIFYFCVIFHSSADNKGRKAHWTLSVLLESCTDCVHFSSRVQVCYKPDHCI